MSKAFSPSSVGDSSGVQLNPISEHAPPPLPSAPKSPAPTFSEKGTTGMLETLSNYYRYGDTKNPKVVYSGPADVMGSDGSKSEEDIATESQYCHVIPGLEDGVDKARVIKVSPDQSQLFVSDGDEAKKKGALHVLNVAEGKLLRKFDYYDIICCLAFANPADPKPTKIYAGTGNGDIVAYDVKQPEAPKKKTPVILKGDKEESRDYDEPLERFGEDLDQSRREIVTAHGGRVYGLKVTHYGRFLISVSEDMTVKIWDIQTGTAPSKPVHSFTQSEKIYSIDSLSFDSAAVLDHEAKLKKSPAWPLGDHKKKKTKDRTKRLPSKPAYMVCTGNRLGQVHVYYLRVTKTKPNGKRQSELKPSSGVGSGISSLLSKSSKKKQSTSEDKLHFEINGLPISAESDAKWSDPVDKNLSEEEEFSTEREILAHAKSVYALLFSDNGSRLYSGAFDRLIKIWDTASLSCLQTLVGHTNLVCTLAVHGDFLCSGSYDKSIKLWHLETGTEVRTITGSMVDDEDSGAKEDKGESQKVVVQKAMHHDRVNDIVFFKNGTNIISASSDKTIKRWNIAMNQEDARVLREWSFSDNSEQIRCMSVSKGTKSIVTGGGISQKAAGGKVIKSGTVRVWDNLDDIETGTSKDKNEEKHANTVTRKLGSTSENDKDGKRRHTAEVEDVVVSEDGKIALSVGNDDKVIYWNLEQAANEVEGSDCFVRSFDTKNRGHSIALTKDKMKFYTGVGNGVLQEWRIQNPNLLNEFHDKAIKKGQAHMGWIMAIKLTSNEKTMVTGGNPDEAKIWDTESRTLLFNLGRGKDAEGNPVKNYHLGPVTDLEITPDDKKVATCSEDFAIKIWDMLTGFLLATLEGHEAEVTSISIRSGGDYLASGSKDKTWKLWTLDNGVENKKEPYKLVYTSSQGEGSLMEKACVAFSDDDSCLLSGSTDLNKTDIFSSEKLGMIFYHLPSVVQECMFENDCSKEDEGSKQMDWESSETTMTLRQEPHVLCEPQIRAPIMEVDDQGKKMSFHKHHMKNLLHLAASDGRSNFIKSSIFYDSKTPAGKEKQKIALKALLMKDSEKKLPIDCAIEFENGATVDQILQGFGRLLSKDFAKPFHEDQNSQEQHPSELFPLKSLCRALEKFPSESLEFVCSLELVSGGDFLVQKGVKRFELPKTKRLVWGSKTRIPRFFWVERVGRGTEFYEEALEKRNQPKTYWALLCRTVEPLSESSFWTGLPSWFVLFFLPSWIINCFKTLNPLDEDENDNEDEDGAEGQDDGRRQSKTRPSILRRISQGGEEDGDQKKEKEQVKDEESKNRKSEYGNPVTAKFVPIKGIADRDSEFLDCLIKAASKTNKYKAFENEVVRSVIEYKWEKFAKEMFNQHMYKYLVMVLCLTLDAFINKTLANGKNWECVFNSGVEKCNNDINGTISSHTTPTRDPYGHPQIYGRIPMMITFALWVHFYWHEIKQSNVLSRFTTKQLKNGTGIIEHWGDFWNKLDMASLNLIFLSYFFRMLYWGGILDNTYATVALSFALPLTWVNLLFFLQGFDESGRLVRMITGIMRDSGTKYFTIILIVCMVGFAAGFFVLYENQNFEDLKYDVEDKSSQKQENPFMSVFSAYTLMLGEFEVTEFPDTSSGEYFSTALLFIVFTAFINIIMLNLLIAIMSDIFDRVQESAQSEFLFARARIILEFEDMLKAKKSGSKNEDVFPTWLQVLTPADEQKKNQSDSPNDEWSGRVQKVTSSIKELEAKIETNVAEAAKSDEAMKNDLKGDTMAVKEALLKKINEFKEQQGHGDTKAAIEKIQKKQVDESNVIDEIKEQQKILQEKQDAFRQEMLVWMEKISEATKATPKRSSTLTRMSAGGGMKNVSGVSK